MKSLTAHRRDWVMWTNAWRGAGLLRDDGSAWADLTFQEYMEAVHD